MSERNLTGIESWGDRFTSASEAGLPIDKTFTKTVNVEWVVSNMDRYYEALSRRNATLRWGPKRWHLKTIGGKREGNEYVLSFGGVYPFPRKPQLSTRNESRRKKHARRKMKR